MSTTGKLNCQLFLDRLCDQMRQLLLMRCATELCDSFNPIYIQFLHLERELSILLLVHDFPS